MSVAAAVLLLALLLLPAGMDRSFATPADDFPEFAFRPHPGAPLPLTMRFIDERGRQVPFSQFFTGKPVVLVLEYLRCQTLCGLTLENLVFALNALPLDAGHDFEVVVLSIDPRDKPADIEAARIKYLAGYHHASTGEGWHFLTAPEAAVRRLADAVGFPYRYEPALDQYIHPAGFVIAAPDGTVSRYLLGVEVHPDALRAALTDAAQGRAVGLVERLVLLCHGTDPNLSSYSLMIEAVFIIANLAAMAGGTAAFFAVWRRRHG